MTQVLLSIGHGYAGRATEAALGPDWQVLGTSRRPGARILWPDQAAQALTQATHLISWVPPGPQGDPVLPLLQGLPAPNLRWIGYASASSLYGDTDGAWIDESAPDAPTTDRGRARQRAEADWQSFATGHKTPLALLRIAGIYGPGRSVLDGLRAGTAQRIVKPGQVFNRIHVHDLGRIAAACAQTRLSGPILLTDAEPAPQAEVTAYGARLLNLPVPPDTPFDAASLSPMAHSFYAENKRLRSVRVGPELGLTLTYPTYREGLKALLP